MTWRTSEDFARETGPTWRGFKGMIRRFLVTLADASTKWQLRGVYGSAGGDEIFSAELFPGIGIFARPPADGQPEAITVAPGVSAKNHVIIATRDEATRAKVAALVDVGETAIYNAVSVVILKADGTIRAQSINGTPVAIALKSDVDELRTKLLSHTHAVATTGTASAQTGTAAATTTPVSAMAGTAKFRAE